MLHHDIVVGVEGNEIELGQLTDGKELYDEILIAEVSTFVGESPTHLIQLQTLGPEVEGCLIRRTTEVTVPTNWLPVGEVAFKETVPRGGLNQSVKILSGEQPQIEVEIGCWIELPGDLAGTFLKPFGFPDISVVLSNQRSSIPGRQWESHGLPPPPWPENRPLSYSRS